MQDKYETIGGCIGVTCAVGIFGVCLIWILNNIFHMPVEYTWKSVGALGYVGYCFAKK